MTSTARIVEPLSRAAMTQGLRKDQENAFALLVQELFEMSRTQREQHIAEESGFNEEQLALALAAIDQSPNQFDQEYLESKIGKAGEEELPDLIARVLSETGMINRLDYRLDALSPGQRVVARAFAVAQYWEHIITTRQTLMSREYLKQ